MKKNQQEQGIQKMRDEVIILELRARYWKAQHDLRFYTLAAEKLQPDYDEWLKRQQEMQATLQQEYMENLEKMKEAGAQVEEKEMEVA